ncbi:hypothetical protein ACQEVB_02910 [Pseudonocardia sp. CA-107938]|uniref:hypothetical protein n=1 Tax=Pseudonocardia sp. CA-107938 TaxID=3240021 RepID=UPI003D944D0E
MRLITTAVGMTLLAGLALASPTVAAADTPAEDFTACVRTHGVPEFPGVTVTSDGALQLKSGGRIDPISATYRDAVAACADRLPAGTTLPRPPSIAAPTVPTLATPAAPAAPALPG